MRYGYFDDQARQYVITQPDTPLPWINYLGQNDFFGLMSNTGGGYTFFRDARLRRLTRYRYNNAPVDSSGRMLYIRDNQTGEFWSPNWQPTRTPLEAYECRHGMGYTVISSSYKGISAQTRTFIPLDETVEIWEVEIGNNRNSPAEISLVSCIEFCLWDAWDDTTNYQRNFSTGQVEVEDGVIYHKTEYRERRNHFAWFACLDNPSGFDTSREEFLGPYRGFDQPLAVEEGKARNSIAYGWAPIGSHQVRLNLDAGESRRVVFLLGYHENSEDNKFDPPGSQTVNKSGVLEKLARYRQTGAVQTEFDRLRSAWDRLLGVLQVETPDVETNRMVNIWNAYQNMITFNMSRSASYFETGIGRGMGFRDSNQDLLGFVHMVPQRARQRILDLAATQLESGGAYHQYQPLTKRGNNDIGSNFNDDPLWLVWAVGAYIKETHDWAILEELVAYDNTPGSEKPLFDHLQRSIQYTLDRRGPHGLPLIGRADWNDCLNLNCFSTEPGQSFQTTTNKDGKVAESVFIAGLFVVAANEMAEMASRRGLTDEAQKYRANASNMVEVVNQHGWDGAWFRRAYDDFSRPVGSTENIEGQIFIEPQGMCVMARIGIDDGRAMAALDSVGERLATQHGIILQQPAYSQYYLHLGEISSYPPGYKENAGIFCHTNPWIMIAEAMLGRNDRAYDYYKRINPAVREAISEVHRCEPYVYAQMIAGRDASTHGEAKNSWLTGTAAWNYVAITRYILGIRADYDGLCINPRIPTGWHGFKAIRHYQGGIYHIHVRREGSGNALDVRVGGKPVEGDVLPLPEFAGQEFDVEAIMR